MKKNILAICCAGLGLVSLSAHAAEGGVSAIPHGAENYMVNAVPPPGLYGLVYGNVYRADDLRDHNGDRTGPPDFKVDANAVIARGLWVTNQKVLGGDLAFHTIVPLVDLTVRAGGQKDSKTGIGDITVGAGVAFHHSEKLHSVALLDVVAPTGSYDKHRLANIGKNRWAADLAYGVTYVNPTGFNGDVKFGYTINRKNPDTNYKSGDEFHFDYAAGYGLGNGWTVGVGGYYFKQLENDKLNGITLANSKSSAFAIGPSIKYDSGKGWFGTLKWEKEIEAENHTKGDAIWLKAAFPL
ncbi:MAG: hypothetical protein GXY45_05230 [Ramlibacter sp.]|nr:hypothetical protein [Ramlibacter sp.]